MVVLASVFIRFSTVQTISSSLFVRKFVWTAPRWTVPLLAMLRVRTPSVRIVLKPSFVRVLTARQLFRTFLNVGRWVQVVVAELHRVVIGRSR